MGQSGFMPGTSSDLPVGLCGAAEVSGLGYYKAAGTACNTPVVGFDVNTELLRGSNVRRVETRAQSLEEESASLKRGTACLVTIQFLEARRYELVKPLTITVRRCDDTYVASFFDANVHASGDVVYEAVENLKDVLTTTFEALSDLRENELGPGPRRSLNALREFIRRADSRG